MKFFKGKKIFGAIVSFLTLEIFLPVKVFAVDNSGVCGILPCNIASPCLGTDCQGNSLTVVGTVLEILLGLVFVGIITYGVWLIVQAAIKIIRSEGNEEQVQAGYKMIKGAYIGIILIFVGIIGMVLIIVLFNSTDIFKVAQTEAPPGITLQ